MTWVKATQAAGGGGGGGPVTIADGADIAEGATTDVAVVTDVNGTVSAKLRGLVKILASVRDTSNTRLKVDINAATIAGVVPVAFSPQSIAGSIQTLNAAVTLALAVTNRQAIQTTIQVVYTVEGGGGAGVLTFEGSADSGVTWVTVTGREITSFVETTTIGQVTGAWVVQSSGLSHVRARVSTATTGGTWNIVLIGMEHNPLLLPSGAPTAVLQSTGNTSLAAIKIDVDKIPSQGQALAAASMPVVLPAAQITTLTPLAAVQANAGTNLNTSALAVENGGNLATIASIVRAEDAASADADKGIGVLAIRKATPANTSSVDGDYEYLQMSGGRLWVDASGKTLSVTLPADVSVSATINSAVTVGPLAVAGYSTAVMQIVSASWEGTLLVEATVDGTTWITVPITSTSGGAAASPTSGATGLWVFGVAGYSSIRARMSAFVSGSLTITLQASNRVQAPLPNWTGLTDAQMRATSVDTRITSTVNPLVVYIRDGVSGIGFEGKYSAPSTEFGLITRNIPSGTQGISAASLPLPTGAALSATQTDRTQKAQITDGTRDGTVKAASTLPLTTDTAFVVTLRESLSTPVTGAFFQATQPVSGTVTTTPPANASTNVAQVAGTAVSVNTGVRDGGTQRVTIATNDLVPIAVTKTDLTPSSPTTASVGIATAQAVASSATRKGLILRNTSSAGQRISLGFGLSAVLDSGVVLYPQDTFYMGDYDFDLGAVNAIASAASASLAVQEYTT